MTPRRWLVVVLTLLAGIAPSVPGLALPHIYVYDVPSALAWQPGSDRASTPPDTFIRTPVRWTFTRVAARPWGSEQGIPGLVAHRAHRARGYDDRSNLARVSARLDAGLLAPRAIATGQEHHVISRRIAAALDDHPTLAGQYTARDPRFVTRAADAAAHRGYQTWHRQLDAEVVDWLARNPNATTSQFERFLQGRYGQQDLLERFPNGF